MAKEVSKRIEDYLERKKTSKDILSSGKLDKLIDIDNAIQARLDNLSKGRELIKNNSINIFNIAKDTKISNKTFYSNDLYKDFVEMYATGDVEKKVMESDFNRLKEENDTLRQQVQDMVMHDIDIERAKHEYNALKVEIADANKRIKMLEEELEKSKNDYNMLKKA